MGIRRYKDIDCLKKELKNNNGNNAKFYDEGFYLSGKRYAEYECGNMGYNFNGNSYITYRHMPYKRKQNVYYNNTFPLNEADIFITIEYDLKGRIFNFVLLRENY